MTTFEFKNYLVSLSRANQTKDFKDYIYSPVLGFYLSESIISRLTIVLPFPIPIARKVIVNSAFGTSRKNIPIEGLIQLSEFRITTATQIEKVILSTLARTKYEGSMKVSRGRYIIDFSVIHPLFAKDLISLILKDPNPRTNYSWIEPLQDIIIKSKIPVKRKAAKGLYKLKPQVKKPWGSSEISFPPPQYTGEPEKSPTPSFRFNTATLGTVYSEFGVLPKYAEKKSTQKVRPTKKAVGIKTPPVEDSTPVKASSAFFTGYDMTNFKLAKSMLHPTDIDRIHVKHAKGAYGSANLDNLFRAMILEAADKNGLSIYPGIKVAPTPTPEDDIAPTPIAEK